MEAIAQMRNIKTVFHQIQNRLEQLLLPDEVANDEPEYKHLLASVKTFRIGIPLLSEVKTLADRVLKSASQQSMKHLERLEDRH